jgi:hypothetical protein
MFEIVFILFFFKNENVNFFRVYHMYEFITLWLSIKIGLSSIFQKRKIHIEPEEKNEIEMKKMLLLV